MSSKTTSSKKAKKQARLNKSEVSEIDNFTRAARLQYNELVKQRVMAIIVLSFGISFLVLNALN